MLAKRIIPCLDVMYDRVVKGINFLQLKDVGNPVCLAQWYQNQGADELVLLDITATNEKRDPMLSVIREVALHISIPFTVGGGITSLEQIRKVLLAGADKVSINTAGLSDPNLITKAAQMFGSQCIVVAIDAKKDQQSWNVYSHGGKIKTERNAIQWATQVSMCGAGEILATSIDRDGTKQGYDVQLIRAISQSVDVPVIASGGAATQQDFATIFTDGCADAALAASLFHYQILNISHLKDYLSKAGIPIRS